jgi:allantoate deiminase
MLQWQPEPVPGENGVTEETTDGGRQMATEAPTIDRTPSAKRIERDIETLAGADYTRSDEAIRRYAYTEEYRATLNYFVAELEALGFEISYDPVGTLVARNRPTGEEVFGVGSHCDSNRNGGKYDGTMGVVTALEVCRLNSELGLDLPLQLISFLEEEGSGFGQMLLGSRIIAQRVTEEDLRERFRSVDDGRAFWEHAEEAGYEPARWRDSLRILDDLTGWIELHIEQARVLQDTGNRLGVVTAIAGYVHGDIRIQGRADHAGATPMDFRLDPAPVAAEIMLELERLAKAAGKGTVGTVGEIETTPGIINVVNDAVRLSLDIRGVDEDAFRGVAKDIAAFAERVARERGQTAAFTERQNLPATPMDQRIVSVLEEAAKAAGEPYMLMPSGAAHDTMCVADHVPSAMVFVPCRDGISHSPEEEADPADAALAAEVILKTIQTLMSGP